MNRFIDVCGFTAHINKPNLFNFWIDIKSERRTMTAETQNITLSRKEHYTGRTFLRVARYTVTRLIVLFVTVALGIFLTIMIANMGGKVDDIMRADIRERISTQFMNDPSVRSMTSDARKKILDDRIAIEENRVGLNSPFMVRAFHFLVNALRLNLGQATNMTSAGGSRQVRLILFERLPATLLLMGTSQLGLFFTSLFLALGLSRSYGSLWDKLTIALSPTSSAPGWFYGIFLILIFAALIPILPFGGLVSSPPPENPIERAGSILKHLILPASSLFISGFFLSIYTWRTFFLIYSSEDYVEMAKAKGLTARNIESRYILRPTLPNIVTNFALTLIGVWGGATITETVFIWPGLGRTLFTAIGMYDTPVIVGDTIVFAYLLAITVFILDFVYVLIDPRVKVGG
jgi:peptide/nickel transport system permease protein